MDTFRWLLKRGSTVQNLNVSLDAVKEGPVPLGPEPHKPRNLLKVELEVALEIGAHEVKL